MSTAADDRVDIPVDILSSFEDYGCRVNALSVGALFQRYEDAGFLYEQKRLLLEPWLPLIQENWKKALRAGETLLSIVDYDGRTTGKWASIASWRSTSQGWNAQHLVSMGDPRASRAVMLSAQAIRIHDQRERAHQCWFRPANRYAARLFGAIGDSISARSGQVRTFEYLSFPRRSLADFVAAPGVAVDRVASRRCAELQRFVSSVRGEVYAQAEEFDLDDLEQDNTDYLYRQVGLRRYRRIRVARNPAGEILGAVVVHRGPLGVNFSFLENRMDLLLSSRLNDSQAKEVSQSLLAAGADEYNDYPPPWIPMVADGCAVNLLVGLGATLLRSYAQSIWLKAAYVDWYLHAQRFYDRLTQLEQRHAAQLAKEHPR